MKISRALIVSFGFSWNEPPLSAVAMTPQGEGIRHRSGG